MSPHAYTLTLALAAGLMAASCASGSGKSQPHSGRAVTLKIDSNLTAEQNLERLAAKEAAAGARPVLMEAPVPSGLDPSAISPRNPSDHRAFLALKDALQEIVANAPTTLPGAPARIQPSDDDRASALRHYARGRAAAMDGRTLMAVTELQKALELDPDSPQIVRELAHAYIAERNATKAAELYERLVDLEPDNDEAMFSVGLAAANRREFARAAAVLGRRRLADKPFDHDPAADILADFTLAWSLREMGYDRASIEAARSSLQFPGQLDQPTDHAARLGSVYRQRGDTWRAIGDAHCRLGEFAQAIEAYGESAQLPTADPAATLARQIYANVRLGRAFSAQRALLAKLRDDEASIGDRHVRLCTYAAEHAAPVDLLRDIVASMYRTRPDDASLARAAASLMPADQALALLREFVGRNPRDLQVVSQLLEWLSNRDMSAAAELVIALIGDHPDLARSYADRFARSVPRPGVAVQTVHTMREGSKDSPARAFLEVRMLAGAGALGEAWSAAVNARKSFPDDAALRREHIHLAAELREPSLLRAIAPDVNSLSAPDLVAVAAAYRDMDDQERAVAIAQAAVDADSQSFQALVELARAHASRAASIASDAPSKAAARADVDAAVRAADAAIAISPPNDDPWEVLVMLYRPGGVLADTSLYEQTQRRLMNDSPESQLLARLAVQDLIAQRRYEQAIERLLNMCESHPEDIVARALAVLSWDRSGKLDDANQWLLTNIERHPGDAALLEQWSLLMITRDRTAEGIEKVQAMLADDPDNFAARMALESMLRSAGRMNEALELGERRLLARPPCARRELELAALYMGANRIDQAVERLEWVRDHAQTDTVTLDQLTSAIGIVGRIKDDDERRDRLTWDLVHQTLSLRPDAPLQVYGSGLRSLARRGETDQRFDELADRAAVHADRANGRSVQDLQAWEFLAQGLADDGHPLAAARALRARLRAAAPLEPMAEGRIVGMILAAEAAAGGRVDEVIRLLRDARYPIQMNILPDAAPPATLAETLYQAGSVYTIVGDADGADRLLSESLALVPDNAMAMNNLGYRRISIGHSDDQSIGYVEKAYQLMPTDPNILDTIGWLRYKQGRFKAEKTADGKAAPGAFELIEKAMDVVISSGERGSGSPEVLDHWGDTQWRIGNVEGATTAWKRAESLLDNPDYRDRYVQSYLLVQTRLWHLMVVDPRVMFERENVAMLERIRKKLEAVSQGGQPSVAPTFAEMAEGRD